MVNRTILDNEIDKLDITTQQKSDIKSNIKLRTVTLGKSRRTEEMTEDNNIDTVPTVFINGKK